MSPNMHPCHIALSNRQILGANIGRREIFGARRMFSNIKVSSKRKKGFVRKKF